MQQAPAPAAAAGHRGPPSSGGPLIAVRSKVLRALVMTATVVQLVVAPLAVLPPPAEAAVLVPADLVSATLHWCSLNAAHCNAIEVGGLNGIGYGITFTVALMLAQHWGILPSAANSADAATRAEAAAARADAATRELEAETARTKALLQEELQEALDEHKKRLDDMP